MAQRPRVFVIGSNKTGTTSMTHALRSLGWHVAPQKPGEVLLEDWARRDFRALLGMCDKDWNAFQDVPFSLADTWVPLDEAFPGSRFILTVRASGDAWFESLAGHHAKLAGSAGPPTAAELQRTPYLRPGWLWRYHQLVFGSDETTVFDRDRYIATYEAHNQAARDHFRDRPDDLLELNVADSDAMSRLCAFLGVPDRGVRMPHLDPSPA